MFKRALFALPLLALLTSCAGIIGIDDAQLEPSSAGGTDGGGTGSGGTDSGDVSLLCKNYCETIQAACTDNFAQYNSVEECKSACALLPPGLPSDHSADTVLCRTYFAKQVAILGEKDLNCPAAGPTGGGKCGTTCDAFCTIAFGACTGDDKVYESINACKPRCEALPSTGAPFSIADDSGNSQECRTYHACAASADPVTHCPHTDLSLTDGPCK